MKIAKLLTAVAVSAAVMFTTQAANAATTLRFGYEAPRTDSQHVGAELFKKLVEERTNGEIVVKLFPDSTLGNVQAMINGIRNGTIDIMLAGANNFSGLSAELNVLDIPFLFDNKEEAYKVLDGKTGEYLMSTLDKVNIKGLAFWDNGFRAMSNNKHPISSPEDVKGIKMRVPGNPMSVQLFEVLGANPVPMALGELYTALETNTVDGQDHPIGIFYSAKLYEVQKYLSLSNHQYTALLMAMSKVKFNRLTEEQQDIVIQAAHKAAQCQRDYNSANEAKFIQIFKDAGVEVTETVDPEPFKAACFDKVSKYYIDMCGDKLVKEIQEQLK